MAKANLEMWVWLEEELRNANTMLLETIQKLRVEMANLRVHNERLM